MKPTAKEIEDRIEFTCSLIARDLMFGEIKKALREKYGQLSHQTLLRYVSRAREKISSEMLRPKKYWLAESLAIYRGIMRSEDATPRDRIAARERIDKLLGLEGLKRVDMGGDLVRIVANDYEEMTMSEAKKLFTLANSLGEYPQTNQDSPSSGLAAHSINGDESSMAH